jgi:drug/metabolite transporter (DMT)-like permease
MKYKIFSLLAVILFSSYPTISKVVLTHNSPLVVMFITNALSALIILFVYGILPEVRKLIRFKKQEPYLFLVAFLAGALAPTCNLFGLVHSSVLNYVLISSLQIPIAVFLSAVILQEQITPSYIISLFFLALGMIIYSTQFFQSTFQFSWNDLFFVVAAFSFALSDVLYKKKVSHLPHEMVLIVRNMVGAVIIFLVMTFLSVESGLQVSFDTESLIGMVLIVLFPIIIAQGLWYFSLEKIKSTDAALLHSFYPIFATLIAFFILHESILWHQILGGGIIIGGLMISQVHFSHHHMYADHLRLQNFKHH